MKTDYAAGDELDQLHDFDLEVEDYGDLISFADSQLPVREWLVLTRLAEERNNLVRLVKFLQLRELTQDLGSDY